MSDEDLFAFVTQPMNISDEFESQAKRIDFIIKDFGRQKIGSESLKILTGHLRSIQGSLRRASKLHGKD